MKPDLSVGQRLALGFGTSALLLGAVLYLTFGWLQDISELRRWQSEVIAPRAEAAAHLEGAVLYRRIAARSYALSPSEERFLEHRRAAGQLSETLQGLAALPKEPDGEEIFAPVAGLVDRFALATDDFADLARAGSELAPLLEAEERMRVAQVALLAPVQELAALQRTKTTEARYAIAAEQKKLQEALAAMAVLVLGLMALTAFLTSRGVRTPTLALLRASRSVTQGDFAPAVALCDPARGAASSRDELRELSHAFGLMAGALQAREARVGELVSELQRTNQQLQLQNGELQSQQEEIQAQSEELQCQNEELLAQGDELLRAVETLGASEERYRLLFNHLGEGFALHQMIYDREGWPLDYRFLEVNPAFETMTGLARAKTVGRTVLEVLPATERFWIEEYGAVARTGKPARFQHYAQALDRHFEVIAFGVGRDRFATLFVEVSELKRAERALRTADRRKSDFLAVLSHELRNPLTPIRHSLAILGRTESGGEQAQRARAVIERQVGHLSRLVDDLLDVTRINSGKIPLQKAPVELGGLLRRSAEDVEAQFQADGIALLVELPEEPLWVDGDPERLTQVVGNLLHNAGKFTPAGGRVQLALREGAKHTVEVRVRDTGAGIPPEVLEHVFEPFVQGDGSLARTRGGLGLGLALVKGLVALHGGTARAASAGPGKGAELTLVLPSRVGPVAEAPAAGRSPAATCRVLLVEDNRDAAETLREVLELSGHEVDVALDGPGALRLARASPPDLVLCDIGLPRMDGYQVAQAFRAEAALAGVYLVALSGYAQPEDLRRARDAGFHEHLAKPTDLQRLEALLTRVPSRGSRGEG